MKNRDNQAHMRYLHHGMNYLVDDLVHATTVFSERPDFKTMHKQRGREGDEESKGKGGASHSHAGDDEGNDGDKEEEEEEEDGLDMDTYRLHHLDRAMLSELKRLRDDPFYTPVAHALSKSDQSGDDTSSSSLEAIVRAIPLVTGDVRRLDSFRRNWLRCWTTEPGHGDYVPGPQSHAS